ncbi:MAG: hypothetical protein HY738_05700, partial [Bacteroidia bacterium]|nr:hypothetical protein [Bacteroidia bacterium]
EEGPFKIKIFIPKHFGGSGSEELAWILCDAPLILYSLIKLGYKDTPGVKEAVTFLLSLVRDNGWGCKCSNIFSKFRGPGRKGDICPYANMLMLKLISVLPELYNHKARKTGVNAFFELWKSQGVNKPYLFGIGSDFKKLKAPLVWYDILHILDILTCFPNLLNHSIIKEMIKLILEKADENGLYKAESVYRAWTGWDFGQKREPSYWISFLVYKILKRIKSTAKAAN